MRDLHLPSIVILPVVLCMVACETKPGMEPYFLVAPDSIAPDISSTLSRWDSGAELRQWVENPWTEGPYSLRFEDGVEFAHVDLGPRVSSSLYGPNLQPPFNGLASVRARVRCLAPATGTPAEWIEVSAYVAPTDRDDPTVSRIPRYSTRVAAIPGEWQVVDLLPEPNRGYPPVVGARWLQLGIGRPTSSEIGVDIDWIELVR